LYDVPAGEDVTALITEEPCSLDLFAKGVEDLHQMRAKISNGFDHPNQPCIGGKYSVEDMNLRAWIDGPWVWLKGARRAIGS
jgi:hypothetical protein